MIAGKALQIEKRDYQTSAPSIIVEALKDTLRALIVMATGLGKTITCGLFLKEYFKDKKSFRVLYLCDKSLGLDQAEKEFFEKLGLKAKPSKFYGNREARVVEGGKQIIFASFQKLASAKEWYKQFPHDHFDMIIVDEAHHAFAPTYYSVIKYFKYEKCPIVGMTATPYRADQKDIKDLFGPPVIDISLEEGIAMGWLSDLKYLIMSDDLDDEKLQKMIDSEFSGKRRRPSINSLNQTLFIRKRDTEIIKQIKFHTQGGKKTLIFCQSIAQAEWFTELLGVSAREFHSSKNSKHNNKVLEEFKNGGVKYLLTVDKLNEAFDMPEVEVVVFLRATDSKRIFFQQLGRGLRKTQTKREVLVLDFVANIERLMHLATFIEEVKIISDKVVGKSTPGEMKISRSDTSLLSHAVDRFVKIESNTVSSSSQTRKSIPTSLPNSQSFVPGNLVYTIEGMGFSFNFSHRVIEAMKLLKVIHEGFYPTLLEASNAAKALGIKSRTEYSKNYVLDIRLHSCPHEFYPNFINYPVFLGVEADLFKPTLEIAIDEMEKKGIVDYWSLILFGSTNFFRATFGRFGTGASLVDFVLKKQGLHNLNALYKLSDKLGWTPSEKQKIKLYKEEFAKHGIYDYASLTKASFADGIKKMDFGKFGKGFAFCSLVLSITVDKMNSEEIITGLAEKFGWLPSKNELIRQREKDLKEYKQEFAKHGIIDYWTLMIGSSRLNTMSFGRYGKVKTFIKSILEEDFYTVNKNLLEKVAEKLGWSLAERQKLDRYKEELAKNAIYDHWTLISVQQVGFSRLKFGIFGGGTAFFNLVMNKILKTDESLAELSKKLGWMPSEKQIIQKYQLALRKNNIKNYWDLLLYNVDKFRTLDFGMFGKGTAFCSIVLGKTLTSVSRPERIELAKIVGWNITEVQKNERYKKELGQNAIFNNSDLLQTPPYVFERMNFGIFGNGRRFVNFVLGNSLTKDDSITTKILKKVGMKIKL